MKHPTCALCRKPVDRVELSFDAVKLFNPDTVLVFECHGVRLEVRIPCFSITSVLTGLAFAKEGE